VLQRPFAKWGLGLKYYFYEKRARRRNEETNQSNEEIIMEIGATNIVASRPSNTDQLKHQMLVPKLSKEL